MTAGLYQQTPSALRTQASSGLADLQAALWAPKPLGKLARLPATTPTDSHQGVQIRSTIAGKCETLSGNSAQQQPRRNSTWRPLATEGQTTTLTPPGREHRHRPPIGARDKQLRNPTIEDLSRNPLTSHLVNCVNFDNTFHGKKKEENS